MGGNRNREENCLAGSQGSVMDIVLHTHLGGTPACGGKEGLLKQKFERLEHPLSSLITSTGKSLLPLFCRLMKIRVVSLRQDSMTSCPHRQHLTSQESGTGWALQSGATHQATPPHTHCLNTP